MNISKHIWGENIMSIHKMYKWMTDSEKWLTALAMKEEEIWGTIFFFPFKLATIKRKDRWCSKDGGIN